MEYVDKYIYLNQINAAVNAAGTSVTFNLGVNHDRPPTFLLEVVSAVAHSANYINGVIVKTENMALNYASPDLKGSTIAVLDLKYDLAVVNNYALIGLAPKLLYSGNQQHITITLEDAAGVGLLLADITPFCMVLKLTYPKPLAIQEAYRSQIPL